MKTNPQIIPLLGRFSSACDGVNIAEEHASAVNKALVVIAANMSQSQDMEKAMYDLLKFHTNAFKNSDAANDKSALRVVQ